MGFINTCMNILITGLNPLLHKYLNSPECKDTNFYELYEGPQDTAGLNALLLFFPHSLMSNLANLKFVTINVS